MKLFILLSLVALAVCHPDGDFYDSKYDSFDIDAVINNERLLKAYGNCFRGKGKCTPEGRDFKKWIPESMQTSCGKCTDKQKVLVAKSFQAMKTKYPEIYDDIVKINDPENKYTAIINDLLKSA